jgi:hypothetical protein
MAYVCRIVLDKKEGITISLEDQKAQVTQTVVMDGTQIKLTCKKAADTSTIVQTPTDVTITCKAFKVDADTVTVTSKEDTVHTSKKKLDLKSTGAMTLSSDDALTAKAAKDWKASGNSLTASATGTAKLSGQDAVVSGTSSAKLSGAQTEVSGSAKVEVKGAPMIKVSSSGTLDLEGQLTNIKGQMTGVKGSMVNLG